MEHGIICDVDGNLIVTNRRTGDGALICSSLRRLRSHITSHVVMIELDIQLLQMILLLFVASLISKENTKSFD